MTTAKAPTVNISSAIKLRNEQLSAGTNVPIHRFSDFVIEFADVPIDRVAATLDESVVKLVADLTISLNPVNGVNSAPVDAFSLLRMDTQGTSGTTYTVDRTVTPNRVAVNISGIGIRVDYAQAYLTRAVDYILSQLQITRGGEE
jgi:hypothetical protein